MKNVNMNSANAVKNAIITNHKEENLMTTIGSVSKREMKNVSINAYKEFLAYLEENSSTIPMNVFFRYCSLNGYSNPFAVRKALTIRLAHYGKASRDSEDKAVKVLSVSIFRKSIEGHEIDAVMNADVIGKNYKERAQRAQRAQRGVISAKLTDREIATIRAALEGMDEDVIKKALDKALIKKLEEKKAREASKKANA